MNWINQEQIDIDKHYGFIYLIEYSNGKKYIGRKELYNVTNVKAKLNGEQREYHYRFYNKNYKGKRTRFEELRKPSKWKLYNGSSKLVKGFQITQKTIIHVCDTPIDLTYWEMYYLMVNNVLFDDIYMNQAIGRNYFSGRITGTKKYIKDK